VFREEKINNYLNKTSRSIAFKKYLVLDDVLFIKTYVKAVWGVQGILGLPFFFLAFLPTSGGMNFFCLKFNIFTPPVLKKFPLLFKR
jgi:hypothetical protein